MDIEILIVTHNPNPKIIEIIEKNVGNNRKFNFRVLVQGKVATKLSLFPNLVTLYIDQNLGCAGARNMLAEKAKSKHLLFIDDDAEILFTYDDLAMIISSGYSCYAGLSMHDDSGQIEQMALPFSFNKKRNSKSAQYVNRFVGVCFIIDAALFKYYMGFRNYFPYGFEDSDLSHRIFLDNNVIWYDPRLKVRHYKPSKNGYSLRKQQHNSAILYNKLKYIKLNFKWYLGFVARIYWCIRYVFRRDFTAAVFILFRKSPEISCENNKWGLPSCR